MSRNVIDTVFLALRQLTCCINNLEKIAIIERRDVTNLKVRTRIVLVFKNWCVTHMHHFPFLQLCRQHFQERMSFCLKRLNDILTSDANHLDKLTTNESNFVSYMDQTIDLVSPLSLQLSLSVENDNKPTTEMTETKV